MLIINTSIETRTSHITWKISHYTPLYKAGENSEKSNYRPEVSKIFSQRAALKIMQQLGGRQHKGELFLLSLGVSEVGMC